MEGIIKSYLSTTTVVMTCVVKKELRIAARQCDAKAGWTHNLYGNKIRNTSLMQFLTSNNISKGSKSDNKRHRAEQFGIAR